MLCIEYSTSVNDCGVGRLLLLLALFAINSVIIRSHAFPVPCYLQWMNDIENDLIYSNWPTGVQELLRASFPGVIRQIRRNFFNLVSTGGRYGPGIIFLRIYIYTIFLGKYNYDSASHLNKENPLIVSEASFGFSILSGRL